MNKIFDNLGNKKVLVLGFGDEGRSTYRIIREEYPEKEVYIADKKSHQELFADLPQEIIDDKKLIFLLANDYLKDAESFDLVIKTPGIRPVSGKVTTQTEIFFEKCRGKIVGVTGTKGKSTTSTLIYEILKKAGIKVFLVGNIGAPALDVLVKENSKDVVYVYELSSHQLHGLSKGPHISVVLNVGVDHLDWHGTQEAYVSAKKNIVKYQKSSDFAILNEGDSVVRDFGKETKAKVIYFTGDKLGRKFKDAIILKGKHNWDNVAAAVSVARLLGIDEEIALSVIKSFKGLEHRLETVGEYKDVIFINDSISTNPVSLKAAIESFSEDLTLIMGGYERGIDYRDLAKAVAGKGNIKNIFLIGQTGERMRESLKEAEYKGNLISPAPPDMPLLVKKAFEVTEKGGIVLLSPGAASFDMFKDYKERGGAFKDAVRDLK